MKKIQLLEALADVDDLAEIDVYDLKDYSHREFDINTSGYFNYDEGRPIVTIELKA